MSVSVDVYTEAKIDGKWVNIDMYTYYPNTNPNHNGFHLIPVVSGASAVRNAMMDIEDVVSLPYEDLSEKLKDQIRDYGDLYLRTLPASWFLSKRLDTPEFSGYIPRQSLLQYEAGITNDPDPNCEMLTPAEYRQLTADEQMAYQYYEWTESWGTRDVWRRIKEGVRLRINAFEDYCRHWDSQQRAFVPEKVDWSNTRIVFHIS